MSKSASSTLYAFGLNSYITPCVADAILINSEDIGQLWIFGPHGRHGARVGHGGKAPGERQERSQDQCCGHILPQAPQWGPSGQCYSMA